MKYSTPRTLYAAKHDGQYIGIFSSRDSANTTSFDTIEEIQPVLLDGSPDSDTHVCVAEGTKTILLRMGDKFDTDLKDVGPCWGCNLQSAIAGLFGLHPGRQSIETAVLRIYEIDHVYSEKLPENIAAEYRATCLIFSETGVFSTQDLSTDYIAIRAANEKRAAEIQAKLDSRYMTLLCDKIQSLCLRPYRYTCSLTCRHIRKDAARELIHHFSLEELRILAVLWNLEKDEEITNQIIWRKITPEMVKDILDRAWLCLPAEARVPPDPRRAAIHKRFHDYIN